MEGKWVSKFFFLYVDFYFILFFYLFFFFFPFWLQFRDVWEKWLFVFGGRMGHDCFWRENGLGKIGKKKKKPNITVFVVPWWAWSHVFLSHYRQLYHSSSLSFFLTLPPIIYHSSSPSFFLTYPLNLYIHCRYSGIFFFLTSGFVLSVGH